MLSESRLHVTPWLLMTQTMREYCVGLRTFLFLDEVAPSPLDYRKTILTNVYILV